MPVILATWEVEVGRIVVQGQNREKVNKAPAQQMSQAWWLMSVNSSYPGGISRMIVV
jgi:hypothetical protein